MNTSMNATPSDTRWPLTLALVEDDRLLREEIEVHLAAHGFQVYAANSAAGLDDLNARIAFDLYLIDLNLPGENGLSLCRRVRQSRPDAGIVIMTARVALNDCIAGYRRVAPTSTSPSLCRPTSWCWCCSAWGAASSRPTPPKSGR